MEAKITTSERKKGMVFKETQFVLECRIKLTPDEARVEPISGNPTSNLTDPYTEEDETSFNFIRWESAISGNGAECYMRSAGQLQESENKIKARLVEIQALLDSLADFQIDKSYTFDPKAEQ